MPDVTETKLPGVGVRHEFTTGAGTRVSVLTHRTGRREIGVYRADDPDVCSTVLRLEREDAQVLAELLGGRPLADAPAGVQQLEGVAIDWIRVGGGADAADKTIAEAQLRTRTGASIVAVARGDDTLPAPGPDVGLEAGDVVVAVGTPEGLRGLRELLEA